MPEEPLEAGGGVNVGYLVGGLDEFKAGHWRRHPLYRSQASATGFRELITLADIDYLLADPRTRPPYLRVTQNARKLDNALITRQTAVTRWYARTETYSSRYRASCAMSGTRTSKLM